MSTEQSSRDDRIAFAALAVVMLLSLALRLPALTWPLNQQPQTRCCGHPDEGNHYEILRSLPSIHPQGEHAPGFAVIVYLAERLGAGHAAQLFVPANAIDHDRTRAIYTARLVSIGFSLLAVWLVYLLGRSFGATGLHAVTGAALVALSPLFSAQSIYGLPDIPNLALVLGYVYVFIRWTKRPAPLLLFGLAFLVGAALAVKLGFLVALPLMLFMILRSDRRIRDAALLCAGVAAGGILVSGGAGASRMRMVWDMVWYDNVTGAERSLLWNAVHYIGSLVAGMGVHAVLIVVVSLALSLPRVRGAISAGSGRILERPGLAVALGCAIHFAAISGFNAAFTRHMLLLYPFLAIFAMVGVSSSPVFHDRRSAILLLLFVIVLGTIATWPVMRSFSSDPSVVAARWLEGHAGAGDCIHFTWYTDRTRELLPWDTGAACAGDTRPARFLVIHSAWSGRFTGSWWLKPRPKAAAEVHNVAVEESELKFWQRLFEGLDAEWRITAAFGDDWPTVERRFLTLTGRGYDQFATPGRIVIAEREAPPPSVLVGTKQ